MPPDDQSFHRQIHNQLAHAAVIFYRWPGFIPVDLLGHIHEPRADFLHVLWPVFHFAADILATGNGVGFQS